jgi:hypothetical protein
MSAWRLVQCEAALRDGPAPALKAVVQCPFLIIESVPSFTRRPVARSSVKSVVIQSYFLAEASFGIC